MLGPQPRVWTWAQAITDGGSKARSLSEQGTALGFRV